MRIFSGKEVLKEQVKVYLDNQLVSTGSKTDVVTLAKASRSDCCEYKFTTSVLVPAGNSRIRIQYLDGLTPDLAVSYRKQQLKLHVVSVGVNGHGISFAGNDATIFAGILSSSVTGFSVK